MNFTAKFFALVAAALLLAPIAFANDWVPADVLQTLQQPVFQAMDPDSFVGYSVSQTIRQLPGHPAASRDSYDRYEDALDRAIAYADANPAPVLQPGYAIPAAEPTKAGQERPTFGNDWVSHEVVAAIGYRTSGPGASMRKREAEKAGQKAYPESSDIF